MYKPELLAPAGNFECLTAAVNAGCDAVYLAGKHYGARSFAGNFSDEELVEAIKYCHQYGVKVYVTINTLIYDSEVKNFIKYVRFLHVNSVDAVIIQDLGMLSLLRQKFPLLEIHASTQMHIHNIEGLKFLKSMGVKRAVVARETSIDEISKMRDIDIDLEVFVHGALCVSYSGQCLMSSLIGGRSGNRGTCAQCCRQKYSLLSDGKIIDKDKYLLSTKDLNTLDNIDKLIDLGVTSFKIEGRMKRPEYVYYVVSLYRKVIDNYLKGNKIKIGPHEIKELKKIFNREFTKGFLFNEDNSLFINDKRPNHIGIEIGKVIDYKKGKALIKLNDQLSINDGIRFLTDEDTGLVVTSMFKNNDSIKIGNSGDVVSIPLKDFVAKDSIVLKTSDYNQLKEINNAIHKNGRKIKIDGLLTFNHNKLKLDITDSVNRVCVYSENIEKSINQSTSKERVEEQLSKLGNTIFAFKKLIIDIPDNLFIPISLLNELRRKAILELLEKRIYKHEFKEEEYNLEVEDFSKEKNLNVLISNYEDYLKIKNDNYQKIYIDDESLYNKIDDSRKVLKLNRVITNFKNYKQSLLVGEIGSVFKYKDVVTDFSLNVTNAYTVAFLHSIGVNKVTLSYELNDYQIEKLIENYLTLYKKHPNLELIVEANEEAMVLKYNMLKKYNLSSNENYLVDRFKNKYKIKMKDELIYLYNYKRRVLKDYDYYYNLGINSLRINL